MSNKLDLAKKLYELYLRGDINEKENAKQKLDVLLKKSGLSISDLDDTEENEYIFRTQKIYKKLFVQVVYSIDPNIKIYTQKYKRHFIVKTTPLNKIEIDNKFNFYLKEFKKELENFKTAFIFSNNLFPPINKQESRIKELSKKEKERISKALKLSASIDKKSYFKQIEK